MKRCLRQRKKWVWGIPFLLLLLLRFLKTEENKRVVVVVVVVVVKTSRTLTETKIERRRVVIEVHS
jgi:hypothetical protein